MGHRKSADNCKIPLWLSVDGKPDGRFFQVGNSFFFHPSVKQLSNSAFRLYLCMALECGGRPSFIFPQSAAKKYGLPKSTFRRNINELIGKGFINKIASGKNLRKPTDYCFNYEWKHTQPASERDFKQ